MSDKQMGILGQIFSGVLFSVAAVLLIGLGLCAVWLALN